MSNPSPRWPRGEVSPEKKRAIRTWVAENFCYDESFFGSVSYLNALQLVQDRCFAALEWCAHQKVSPEIAKSQLFYSDNTLVHFLEHTHRPLGQLGEMALIHPLSPTFRAWRKRSLASVRVRVLALQLFLEHSVLNKDSLKKLQQKQEACVWAAFCVHRLNHRLSPNMMRAITQRQ